MSDLVGNPKDRFSHVAAHLCLFVAEILSATVGDFNDDSGINLLPFPKP